MDTRHWAVNACRCARAQKVGGVVWWVVWWVPYHTTEGHGMLRNPTAPAFGRALRTPPMERACPDAQGGHGSLWVVRQCGGIVAGNRQCGGIPGPAHSLAVRRPWVPLADVASFGAWGHGDGWEDERKMGPGDLPAGARPWRWAGEQPRGLGKLAEQAPPSDRAHDSSANVDTNTRSVTTYGHSRATAPPQACDTRRRRTALARSRFWVIRGGTRQ